jgi:hypothetical protein
MPDVVKDELDVMACNEDSKRLVWLTCSAERHVKGLSFHMSVLCRCCNYSVHIQPEE